MKKIYVFLANGFEEIEAITPIDIWRRANFSVTTISIETTKLVEGAHQIVIAADLLFDEIEEIPDLIFLPGGMPGSLNLKNHFGLNFLLKEYYASNILLTAICAAPMVFGQNGFLKDKKATCYPGFENELLGAVITGQSIEIDKNIITGKGAGIAVEFALKIVERLSSEIDAKQLAHQLQISNN